MTQTASARAYGSIGNVGPGLDILGLAVDGRYDSVTITETLSHRGLRITDPGHPTLPTDPTLHSAGLAAAATIQAAAAMTDRGYDISVRKGLPLSGGQGGSAASAVAGAAAMNRLLGDPLSMIALAEAALAAETVVAGRHADNLGPALLGGLVLVRTTDPLDLIKLPVPQGLYLVVIRPLMEMPTRRSRAVLPSQVPREVALHQAAQVAAIVAASHSGDLELLGRAIDDRIAEPARAPLLQGFDAAKLAAQGAGALGCSISGAGPSAFALVKDPAAGNQVAAAMSEAYLTAGLDSEFRIVAPRTSGVEVW